MRLILLLLTLILCNITSYGESDSTASQYIFDNKYPQSAFSYSNIGSIVGDHNNMMWISSDNGLYYYNNREYIHYKHDAEDPHSIPSNNVTTLYCDSNGTVWIVTRNGICYYDAPNDRFTRLTFGDEIDSNIALIVEYDISKYLTTVDGKLFTFTLSDPDKIEEVECPTESYISALYKSEGEEVYIGCNSGELYSFRKSLEKMELVYSATRSKITSVCQLYNYLYIAYFGKGVDRVNLHDNSVTKYRNSSKSRDTRLPSNNIRCINKRSNGDVWIGTSRGVVVITPANTITVTSTPYNQLSSNSIYSIHIDKNDNVWLGTWGGKVSYYSPSNYRFRFDSGESISSSDHGAGGTFHFTSNDDGSTWVGGENAGLNLYDHKSRTFTKQYDKHLNIKCMEREGDECLWIGTIGQGLYRFNKQTEKIENIETILPPRAIISAMAIDKTNNTVWIGTRGFGFLSHSTQGEQSLIYDSRHIDDFDADFIWDIKLYNGVLLICSNSGFMTRDIDGSLTTYELSTKATTADKTAYSCHIPKDSDVAYITTKEHGIKLFDLKTKKLSDLDGGDAFKSISIYNVVADSKKRLWITSNNGIYSYHLLSKKIKHFTDADGLVNMQFHPNSCSISSNDILYCGTSSGIHFIDTKQIKVDRTKPEAFLSGLQINNAALNDENCLLIDTKHFADTKQINLSHDNNSLTILFTSNNSLKSEKSRFKYRFLGYQDEWVYTESSFATFTEIPFGRYNFEVAACNSDGVWGESNVIGIRIYAPIYLKWYAILIYLVVAIVIIINIVKQVAFRIEANKSLEIEREINAINSRTFDEKAKFFMNISHELRTPLSLIKAPLNLLEQNPDSQVYKSHIRSIRRNTERLLHLTNQILDFRLLEVNKLNLIRSKFNLVALCEEVVPMFEYIIKDKRINFSFTKSNRYIPTLLDRDMINKILYNLISNAIKYSDDGASITLSIANTTIESPSAEYDICKGQEVVGNAVIITVADSGQGISKESLPHIFDRFYFCPNRAYSSSGIGLHMCMEYAKLHGGNICVTSEEGKGSTFTVTIPTEEVVATENGCDTTTLYQAVDCDSEIEEMADNNSNKPKVLIVDDNSEIRFYLKKILSRSYNCITAKNGLQAYNLASEVVPDIIILDVLMPVMDGVECAEKLHKGEETKYIPIIMLSAVTEDNNIVQGVKAGADVYISKPINEQLLLTHVENLIQKSNESDNRAKRLLSESTNRGRGLSFADKIEEILEDNIQNCDLDVNLIVSLMAVSRSTLHRNFKRDFGMGVGEYIRDYRLNRAVQYLKNGVFNIDELATCVGFSSSSYFSKAFKDKYGVSPKRYYTKYTPQ